MNPALIVNCHVSKAAGNAVGISPSHHMLLYAPRRHAFLPQPPQGSDFRTARGVHPGVCGRPWPTELPTPSPKYHPRDMP